MDGIMAGFVGDDVEGHQKLMKFLREQVGRELVSAAMPIQDAIELAHFLIHTTIQYYRFLPGVSTVGGAIELAAITRHEGFKWVQRRHFFDASLQAEPRVRQI